MRDIVYGPPTSEAQEAIALFSGQNVYNVFAYLKYARSASDGSQRHEDSAGQGKSLTPEEVQAINTLSGCADRKLRTWLRDAQTSSMLHLTIG